MFERKDVIPASFLFVLIITIMITLSQILVVHNTNHNTNRNKPREIRKFQTMLMQLERSIDSMMKKNVLPCKKHEQEFLALIYSLRINSLMKDVQKSQEMVLKGIDTLHTVDENEGITLLLELDKLVSSALQNQQSKDGSIPGINPADITEDTRTRQTSADINISELNHRRNLLRNISPDVHRDGDEFKAAVNYAPNRSSHGGKLNGDENTLAESRYASSMTSQADHIARRARHKELPRCAEIPADLIGNLRINLNIDISTLQHSQPAYGAIQRGGVWRPTTCVASHRVAIIIPYRDRRKHLQVLLANLLPVLQRQQLDFRIFVVEQEGVRTFNKGRLMNAAFLEALKIDDYHCFVFHDVDMLPENDRNMYSCPQQPRHMSVAVDKFNYILPYTYLTGGVFSIKREHFQRVNGFSNLYWGWGAEDDDMGIRLGKAGLKITRPPAHIARYSMIKHTEREQAPIKWRKYLLQTVKKRYQKDGLNSLEYNVTFINNTALFTHILVNIGEPPKQVPNISAIIR